MSERTLRLKWCSFTYYADYEFPKNIRLVDFRLVFNKYEEQLFNENIRNNDKIWRTFFKTYLSPFGPGLIDDFKIVKYNSNLNRKFARFNFFENTVEITFQESNDELNDFVKTVSGLYKIISKDIIKIHAFFDLEFNYLMKLKLKDKTEYEADFEKRFESKEMAFYNIFEPIRNYLTTHFKGHDIEKSDFVYGGLRVFEI